MKIFFLLAFNMAIGIVSFAQYNIVRTYVFSQSNLPGTIMKDDNGVPQKPPVTTHVIIYFKVKSTATLPLFTKAK